MCLDIIHTVQFGNEGKIGESQESGLHISGALHFVYRFKLIMVSLFNNKTFSSVTKWEVNYFCWRNLIHLLGEN